MPYRMDKVDKLIHREVSIILNQIKDKYLGFLTVVRVETTKDLSLCHVYLSSLEGKSEEEINNVLKHYNRDIYAHIKSRVKMKKIPHLVFKMAKSLSVLDLI